MKNYSIIKKPSQMFVGITCRTSNESHRAPKDIPALWHRFYNEKIASLIPNKASDEIVSLYFDYEKDHTGPYTCLVGCPVTSLENIPASLVAKKLQESLFALYSVKGEFPKVLIAAWQEIWQSDLKRSYSGDYELYGDNFFKGKPPEASIFIALRDR
jgi:predicted transcriptional regulator YdeE